MATAGTAAIFAAVPAISSEIRPKTPRISGLNLIPEHFTDAKLRCNHRTQLRRATHRRTMNFPPPQPFPPPPPSTSKARRLRKRQLEQLHNAQGPPRQGPRHPNTSDPRSTLPTDPNNFSTDQILSDLHHSPGGLRPSASIVPLLYTFGPGENHPLHARYPRPRCDAQHPMILQPAAPHLPPATIENSFITGIPSDSPLDLHHFTLYLTTAPPSQSKPAAEATAREYLAAQIGAMLPAGTPPPSPDSISLKQLKTHQQFDFPDKYPSPTATAKLPEDLQPLPHLWLVTAAPTSPHYQHLLALASRQCPWTAPLHLIDRDTTISRSSRNSLLTQIPLLVRSTPRPPTKAAKATTLDSEYFRGKDPESALRFLSEAALYTLQKQLDHPMHTAQNYRARALTELSQPTQALLQLLDAIQPAEDPIKTNNTTLSYKPVQIHGNPYLTQSQRMDIHLQHPSHPNGTIKIQCTPPKRILETYGKGAWKAHPRQALLLQSADLLPVPPEAAYGELSNDSWIYSALDQALQQGLTFLDSEQRPQPDSEEFYNSLLALDRAPDGAIIMGHSRSQKSAHSSMQTNLVVVVQNPLAYSLLATTNRTYTVELPTPVTIRGTSVTHRAEIRINPAAKSILGEYFFDLLTHHPTQSLYPHLHPLHTEKKNGSIILMGKRMEKLDWAQTLLGNPHLLSEYDSSKQQQPTPQPSHPPTQQQPSPARLTFSLPESSTTPSSATSMEVEPTHPSHPQPPPVTEEQPQQEDTQPILPPTDTETRAAAAKLAHTVILSVTSHAPPPEGDPQAPPPDPTDPAIASTPPASTVSQLTTLRQQKSSELEKLLNAIAQRKLNIELALDKNAKDQEQAHADVRDAVTKQELQEATKNLNLAHKTKKNLTAASARIESMTTQSEQLKQMIQDLDQKILDLQPLEEELEYDEDMGSQLSGQRRSPETAELDSTAEQPKNKK